MNQAAQALLQQQLRHYAQDCSAAAARIGQLDWLRDIVRAADVHRPSLVAMLTHLVPEKDRLRHAAERRIEQICKRHLEELQQIAEAGDAERFGEELGRHRQEWQVLRGPYARQLQMVEREADRLRHHMERRSLPPQRPGG